MSVGSESEVNDNGGYAMLERDTTLEILSGVHNKELITVKTVRFGGSGLDVVSGRRYLLVGHLR